MSQNSERLSWTFEEVDAKLQQMMKSIYHAADDAAKEYCHEGNYVMGANIAGFQKLADAMILGINLSLKLCFKHTKAHASWLRVAHRATS